MKVNGNTPDINYMPFSSEKSMVISVEKDEGSGVIYKYIAIGEEVTYKKGQTKIEGIVLSYDSIEKLSDNTVIKIPLNSLIETEGGFEGRTVLLDDDNFDITYSAEDIQVILGFQVSSGFATYGINEKIEARAGMNIHVGRCSGVVDGIAFYFNKGVNVELENGGASKRIDTIVVRKDQTNRRVYVAVKKGDSSDTSPPLTQEFLGTYEIAICDVLVDANQREIKQENIRDRRSQYSYKISRVGEIVAWSGDIWDIPKDALICDGRSISRTAYANLFSKIGTIWGIGDGEYTFNIPDGQGGVPKGIGNSLKYTRGEDTDNKNRNVGTYQNTAIRNITGGFQGFCESHSVTETTGCFSKFGLYYKGINSTEKDCTAIRFDAARAVPVGTSNRDNNFGINWIIFI